MDETRNESSGLQGEDDGDSIQGGKTGTDLRTDSTEHPVAPTGKADNDLQAQQTQETQGSKSEAPRRTPGEANPALAETEGYRAGTVSTADFLRARGSAEARLPDALEHRDKGFRGRSPHHGHPSPPVDGVTSDAHLYDREERHIMHEEPEMHVFAPRMVNLPSQEKVVNAEREENEE